jgi:hypothetical protein
MNIPLRTALIQAVPWFFGPCFECLGFLHRDHGFSYDGECHGGPDAYARLFFTDDKLQIEVLSWLPMGLPTLTVTSLRGKRNVLDLRAVVPEQALAGDTGDYYGRFMQVHPLNKQGRAEVDREFERAVAERIREFGVFLHDHVGKLRHAA